MSLFWTQRKIFWRKFVIRLFWGTIDFHNRNQILWKSMVRQNFSVPLCLAEQRHSYRFGTTWGWVNDDLIFIFGWIISLTPNSLYTSPDPVLHLMSDFLMYFSHHGLQQISKALMTGFIYIWSHVSIQASSSLYIIETQCSSAVTAERRRRLQDHRHPQSIPGHLSSRLSQRCKHTHWVFRIWMRVCKCCSSIQKTSA